MRLQDRRRALGPILVLLLLILGGEGPAQELSLQRVQGLRRQLDRQPASPGSYRARRRTLIELLQTLQEPPLSAHLGEDSLRWSRESLETVEEDLPERPPRGQTSALALLDVFLGGALHVAEEALVPATRPATSTGFVTSRQLHRALTALQREEVDAETFLIHMALLEQLLDGELERPLGLPRGELSESIEELWDADLFDPQSSTEELDRAATRRLGEIVARLVEAEALVSRGALPPLQVDQERVARILADLPRREPPLVSEEDIEVMLLLERRLLPYLRAVQGGEPWVERYELLEDLWLLGAEEDVPVWEGELARILALQGVLELTRSAPRTPEQPGSPPPLHFPPWLREYLMSALDPHAHGNAAEDLRWALVEVLSQVQPQQGDEDFPPSWLLGELDAEATEDPVAVLPDVAGWSLTAETLDPWIEALGSGPTTPADVASRGEALASLLRYLRVRHRSHPGPLPVGLDLVELLESDLGLVTTLEACVLVDLLRPWVLEQLPAARRPGGQRGVVSTTLPPPGPELVSRMRTVAEQPDTLLTRPIRELVKSLLPPEEASVPAPGDPAPPADPEPPPVAPEPAPSGSQPPPEAEPTPAGTGDAPAPVLPEPEAPVQPAAPPPLSPPGPADEPDALPRQPPPLSGQEQPPTTGFPTWPIWLAGVALLISLGALGVAWRALRPRTPPPAAPPAPPLTSTAAPSPDRRRPAAHAPTAMAPTREVTSPTRELRLPPRYEDLSYLGQGGMCHVYRAHDRELGRVVAVKALLPHLASEATMQLRFLDEARAMASLSHPSIVTVHDVLRGDPPCFIMEYVEGETLRQLLDRSDRLGARQTIRIGLALADALAHAHQRGVIHRDIKPENIILAPEGRTVLVDFGLVKVQGSESRSSPDLILGSLGYMAPEQIEGRPVTPLTDLHALGVVLYELVSGVHPSQRTSLQLPLFRPPQPAARLPELPSQLAAAIDQAMAFDPTDRQTGAAQLREQLRQAHRELVQGRTPAPPGLLQETVTTLAELREGLVLPLSEELQLVEDLAGDPTRLLEEANRTGFLRRVARLGRTLIHRISELGSPAAQFSETFHRLHSTEPHVAQLTRGAAGQGFTDAEELRRAHSLFRELAQHLEEVLGTYQVDLERVAQGAIEALHPDLEVPVLTAPGQSFLVTTSAATTLNRDLGAALEALVGGALQAGASTVEVRLSRGASQLAVMVADDLPVRPEDVRESASNAGPATAVRLVRRHGGTVSRGCDGRLGGYCFTIHLPVAGVGSV